MRIARMSGAEIDAIFLPNIAVIDYVMHLSPLSSRKSQPQYRHE